MKTSVLKATFVVIFVLLLNACAPRLSYESVEWRVVALAGNNANVEVLYRGLVSARTNGLERMEVAEELLDFIQINPPADPYTPGLFNARRSAYIEDGKLVVKESGSMNDPLSWSEQSGLNPLRWFTPSLGLNVRDKHIVKRGIDPKVDILASNGQILDSATYNTRYNLLNEVSAGTLERDSASSYDQVEVIVWPGAANSFYWKLSGPSYGKKWTSLAPEISALKANQEKEKIPDLVSE